MFESLLLCLHCIPCMVLHLSLHLLSLQFVDEVGLTHVAQHPARLRGSHNVLSHLPLHSQQPSRALGLLIPIGGIHMIQPRSPLPVYSLVTSPTAAAANPTVTGISRTPRDTLKGRFSQLQRQDTLKEMSPGNRGGPTDPKASGEMSGNSRSDSLSCRKNQGCFSVQQPSSPRTETRNLEVSTDAHVTERCVYRKSSQGQTETPSSQT